MVAKVELAMSAEAQTKAMASQPLLSFRAQSARWRSFHESQPSRAFGYCGRARVGDGEAPAHRQRAAFTDDELLALEGAVDQVEATPR
jgi:hypothetical protein